MAARFYIVGDGIGMYVSLWIGSDGDEGKIGAHCNDFVDDIPF